MEAFKVVESYSEPMHGEDLGLCLRASLCNFSSWWVWVVEKVSRPCGDCVF